MDRTKQRSGVANVGSHDPIEPDADLFDKSSGAASLIDEKSFVNEYAAASQARAYGRSPRAIEQPQSSRPNPQSSPDRQEEVSKTEPLATEIQDQCAGADIEPLKATPSPLDAHAKQTAPALVQRLMRVGDVAVYLNTSVTAVWRLKDNDPDFPQPIKIGGSTRWDPAEIDCYVDVCKARRPNGR